MSDERGTVVWHSSTEDGGPDVGISIGLGERSIYVGAIGSGLDKWWLLMDGNPIAEFMRKEDAVQFMASLEIALND